MKRSWAVRPDETGTVGRDALIGAMIDGATMLDIAGGVLSVVVGRAPTDVPGEMVMTGALLEWKDRTETRAQPEAPVAVTPPARREPEPVEAELEAEANPDIDPSDGFDYSLLTDEDVDAPVKA